jgi:hypothetical protein
VAKGYKKLSVSLYAVQSHLGMGRVYQASHWQSVRHCRDGIWRGSVFLSEISATGRFHCWKAMIFGAKNEPQIKIIVVAATKIQLGGYVTILLFLQVHHMMLLQ